jgi:hypothetical protein
MREVGKKTVPTPPVAAEKGGTEVLRASMVEGRLEVSLRRAFEEPDVWGVALADVARHAARIFAKETKISEEETLDKTRMMFNAEIDKPTDAGTTRVAS